MCCRQKRELRVLFTFVLLLLLVSWSHVWTFARPSRSVPKLRHCWQVSNFGRFRNLRGTISHGNQEPTGYKRVGLKGKSYLMHRLVKLAFHGPPWHEQAWQVNHLDGNKSNNTLENLQCATQSENIRHSCNSRSRQAGSHGRSVMWRAAGSSRWTTSPSIKSAAKQLGLSESFLRRILHGRRSAKDYELKFAPAASLKGEKWRNVRDPKTGRICCSTWVSSFGRLKFKSERISRGSRQKHDYFRVGLVCLQQRWMFVHQLVASAFLPDPPGPEFTQINHKDGDKGNNRVENLEYVTPAENVAHHHAVKGIRAPRKDRKVVESRLYGSDGAWVVHPSLTNASKVLGVNGGAISLCTRGQQRQTGGYEFRLAAANVEDLPGEEWQDVNLTLHLRDKASRR